MIDAIITPIVTSIPLLLLILVALIFVKSAVKIVPQGNAGQWNALVNIPIRFPPVFTS